MDPRYWGSVAIAEYLEVDPVDGAGTLCQFEIAGHRDKPVRLFVVPANDAQTGELLQWDAAVGGDLGELLDPMLRRVPSQ